MRQGICLLVRQAGFEPTTLWFVARYSIQLSYWRTEKKNSALEAHSMQVLSQRIPYMRYSCFCITDAFGKLERTFPERV